MSSDNHSPPECSVRPCAVTIACPNSASETQTEAWGKVTETGETLTEEAQQSREGSQKLRAVLAEITLDMEQQARTVEALMMEKDGTISLMQLSIEKQDAILKKQNAMLGQQQERIFELEREMELRVRMDGF
jgi:hypothetical protein